MVVSIFFTDLLVIQAARFFFLICKETLNPECTSGSVRLVGGSDPSEGLLEICLFRRWELVCFSKDFSAKEAEVACNSLGYASDPSMQTA